MADKEPQNKEQMDKVSAEPHEKDLKPKEEEPEVVAKSAEQPPIESASKDKPQELPEKPKTEKSAVPEPIPAPVVPAPTVPKVAEQVVPQTEVKEAAAPVTKKVDEPKEDHTDAHNEDHKEDHKEDEKTEIVKTEIAKTELAKVENEDDWKDEDTLGEEQKAARNLLEGKEERETQEANEMIMAELAKHQAQLQVPEEKKEVKAESQNIFKRTGNTVVTKSKKFVEDHPCFVKAPSLLVDSSKEGIASESIGCQEECDTHSRVAGHSLGHPNILLTTYSTNTLTLQRILDTAIPATRFRLSDVIAMTYRKLQDNAHTNGLETGGLCKEFWTFWRASKSDTPWQLLDRG